MPSCCTRLTDFFTRKSYQAKVKINSYGALDIIKIDGDQAAAEKNMEEFKRLSCTSSGDLFDKYLDTPQPSPTESLPHSSL